MEDNPVQPQVEQEEQAAEVLVVLMQMQELQEQLILVEVAEALAKVDH